MTYDIEGIVKMIISRKGERDVVFWGLHKELMDDLSSKGIAVKYIFTQNKELLDSNNELYRPLSELSRNSYRFFLICPYFKEDNLGKLEEMEYLYDKDFIGIQPLKEWKVTSDNYRSIGDCNRVIGCPSAVKISIHGIDNEIIFKNVIFNGKLDVKIVGSHNRILIENGCELNGNSVIFVNGNKHNIYIGNNTKFTDVRISCFIENSRLIINEHATFMKNVCFVLHKDDIIEIDSDCLVSFDVVFQVGDGHSIFDIHTGKNINCGVQREENGIQYSNSIQLERHVWVGRRSIILGGNTIIREGSIVGAGAFVKGQYNYNNVIIAGVPAKIKKKDVAWSRKNFSESISDCGECINFSEEFLG